MELKRPHVLQLLFFFKQTPLRHHILDSKLEATVKHTKE